MVNDRIPFLDLMRFLAALSVVCFHYFFLGGVHGKIIDVYLPAIGEAAKYGYLGVDIFFVISGLVIAWSAEGSDASSFAWKRFLRVYPTFIFCACLTGIVVFIADDPRFTVTWMQVVAHFFIDSRRLGYPLLDDSYWTIIFELIFYAMVTVGLSVPALRRRAGIMLWAWLLLSIANEFFLQTRVLSYFLVSDFAGFFIIGISMYRLRRGQKLVNNIFLLTVGLFYAAERAAKSASVRFDSLNIDWSLYVVLGILGAALLVLYVSLYLQTSHRTAKFLKKCGALTYPLYLLHGTIGFILINRLSKIFSAEIALFVSLSVMLMLAFTVAVFIEPHLKYIFEILKRQIIVLAISARRQRRV